MLSQYICAIKIWINGLPLSTEKITQICVKATVLYNLTSLSKAEISKILLEVSLTTVKAEMGALIKGGSIQRIETGRVSKSEGVKSCK